MGRTRLGRIADLIAPVPEMLGKFKRVKRVQTDHRLLQRGHRRSAALATADAALAAESTAIADAALAKQSRVNDIVKTVAADALATAADARNRAADAQNRAAAARNRAADAESAQAPAPSASARRRRGGLWRSGRSRGEMQQVMVEPLLQPDERDNQ